ncbi:Tex family protein [Numidum massiliense]|uniref:Tex family protein n=1 Tax=Numidum massiliense TaxID=1522315 RepID=UPI0006D58156|nr:Tex family protein [Numidum massiliense]
MELSYSEQIATELNIRPAQVEASIRLLDEGNTIPFIARYRKEMTDELNEDALRAVDERYRYLKQLTSRKEEVIRLIDEQEKLTEELAESIRQATKLQEVDDLYRPYRPKRKTRGSIAREKGLEPLAAHLKQCRDAEQLEKLAIQFVSVEQEVATPEEALAGASDIVAEEIADRADIRQWVRQTIWREGNLHTTVRDESIESVYEMYYDYTEPIDAIPPHRVLAINRGEKEGVLRIKIEAPEEAIYEYIQQKAFGSEEGTTPWWDDIVRDSYKRLIAPAIERDIRNELTDKGEVQAIHIFTENLRNLLLQPPLPNNVVLGVDPAYRTGCKLAVVDDTGKLLHVEVCYPTPPQKKIAEAKLIFHRIIKTYNVSLIAIGNGTASRETELFVADVIKECSKNVQYIVVNEAGASVYSASKVAQDEFPDLDVSERSAVSIARRIQDPLAELVKIEPKAVGVGQYQHDVNQKKLSESLQAVVESAVNHVGVDLNTASTSLLQYVSGITPAVARNIVKYRETEGRFNSREELKHVPRLGTKTFEQSVGFLRIPRGEHPLDNTPIHPESYSTVEALLDWLGADYELIGVELLNEELRQLDYEAAAKQLNCGIPTLKDIVEALLRPGRDPRASLPKPNTRTDILKIEDLSEGMKLEGTVRNVVDFGAFVDIGLKNDALVHISKLSTKFVRHPMQIVSVGDHVDVWVIGVDTRRERVSLSMIPPSL